MSGIDCAFDSHGCLVCPELPAVQGEPAYVEQSPMLGWNAGANSITQLDGDVHTIFTVGVGASGVVMGFKGTRALPTVPELVAYGFYFQSLGGFDMVQVIERGATRTSAVLRGADDRFEVRRSSGQVTYWQNGTLVYTSAVASSGALVVNACLYASGDSV